MSEEDKTLEETVKAIAIEAKKCGKLARRTVGVAAASSKVAEA